METGKYPFLYATATNVCWLGGN